MAEVCGRCGAIVDMLADHEATVHGIDSPREEQIGSNSMIAVVDGTQKAGQICGFLNKEGSPSDEIVSITGFIKLPAEIDRMGPFYLTLNQLKQPVAQSSPSSSSAISPTSLGDPLKKYVCEFCSKAFNRRRALVKHRRIHTGERPFKCHICGAAFTQESHRSDHVRTHDPNCKPHECKTCGKRFARKFSLTMHTYVHEGVYRFTCSFCERKFRQNACLRKHLQAVHKCQFSQAAEGAPTTSSGSTKF